MSRVKSIGEQVRSSVSYLSFQGSNPDFELMKEVYEALKEFMESEKCEKINKVSYKIDHYYIASRDFSFIKTNQLKFICSILIDAFVGFYRSIKNKHGDVLLKLMKMMIEEPDKREIGLIMQELRLTYYWNDEKMLYYDMCDKILNMTPDQFMTSSMDDFGFDVDSESSESF